MTREGRVAEFDGRGQFTIVTESVAPPDDGELLVDVEAAVISAGTHGGRIKRLRDDPRSDYGTRTIGYQTAGTVVETGEGVERFEPGDDVVAMGGGYAIQADYNVVPVNLCAPLPENVSFAEGAHVHLAATALQGVRRFGPEPGAYGAVIGLGVVGQFASQLWQLSGGTVVGSDLFARRRETAADLGAAATCDPTSDDLAALADEITNGVGLDGGFMCFGGDGTEALHDLVAAMKEAPDGETLGTVVLIGGLTVTVGGGARLGNVDIRCSSRTGPGYHDDAFERGEDYPAGYVRWPTTRNLEAVMDWFADDRLAAAPLITHRFPLDDINAAYDQVVETPEETVSVVVRCDDR